MISRRRFVSRSVLAAGTAAGFPFIARSADAPATVGQKPERIIHMVADGMSLGTLTCADYLSHQLRQRGLTWIALANQPGVKQGLMNMRSLDSMVTDSSAASSSWGSGSRVRNGVVNQLPSGKPLTTLYELFSQAGWKRGLVTTTEITHATPAGFAAATDSRGEGDEIAQQYLERGVDVLLGGGSKFIDPARRRDKRDLRADFAAAGYHVMRTASDLASAPTSKRWIGTFSDSHLPYTLDQISDPRLMERVPVLAAMTGRALEWLGRNDQFILQVEGGRVDHGAHSCDAAAALRDLIAFDEALDVVLAFQKRHPNTLVVITTDHGNGNMGVNGSGDGYRDSSRKFKQLAGIKASFSGILRELRRPRPTVSVHDPERSSASGERPPGDFVPEIKHIQEVVAELTGYAVPDRKAGLFQAYLAKKGAPVYDAMNSDVVQLGQLLANHISVGWTSNAHTSDYVPVTAFGPGCERFSGFIQNVDVFRHYTDLANIDFRNPEEPLMASHPIRGGEEAIQEYA
ncbi:MAG TPA: alkaline phosphatase [Verrucomicrobiae bacterium]|nr:alkaline phosphatase [Verrucomicrobiae bacterium]